MDKVTRNSIIITIVVVLVVMAFTVWDKTTEYYQENYGCTKDEDCSYLNTHDPTMYGFCLEGTCVQSCYQYEYVTDCDQER
ncbi:hypothetical protein GOV09_05975 [Candidatus Woesearchaeota archaeon]|nr:hypothetical protein [Candidatus Woesearchaeota archaeon]